MAPEEYQNDFTDPAQRERFLATLQKCARVEVAPNAGERTSRYAEAGVYIAHCSDVLVAFWDGRQGRGPGGTADIVAVRESGAGVGPVFQIVTPRGDDGDASSASVVKRFPRRYSGDDDFEKDFARALACLDQYNRDLASTGEHSESASTIQMLRDRTDAVANRLQTTTFRFLYALYVIAIVATAAQYTTSLLLKFAMFPIAFGFYRIAKRFDYENRYQDYRALSEGLRVQAAWFGAGLLDHRADRCYLGMQEKELQWIRIALRNAYFAFRPSMSGGRVTDLSCRDWIDEQWTYFKNKPRREERWLGRLKLASQTTFWLALVVSAALFAFLFLPTSPDAMAVWLEGLSKAARVSPAASAWLHSMSQSMAIAQSHWKSSALLTSDWYARLSAWDGATVGTEPSRHHAWLVRLSTGVLALYAAVTLLISNYADKRGFALNVRRYDRMFIVFDRARNRLAALPDPSGAAGVAVVEELGRAALIENADWLLTKREHPLGFVT